MGIIVTAAPGAADIKQDTSGFRHGFTLATDLNDFSQLRLIKAINVRQLEQVMNYRKLLQKRGFGFR